MLRSILTTIGELAGALAIAGGVGMFSPAAGVIVAGVELVVFSWLAD